MEVKLYVGNLSYTTTAEELRTAFAEAGTVSSVDIIMDRMTGTSKGFAFVQMSTQAEAEKAIRMLNGYRMGGRELKVSVARPKEEGGSGGFGGPRRSEGGFGRRPGGSGGPGGNRDNRGGRGGGDRRGGGGSGYYQ